MNRVLEALVAPYRLGVRGLDARIWVVVSCTLFFIAARVGLMTYLAIYFVRDVGLTLPLVGFSFLLENFVRGVVAPASGALSDRVGRRPVLITALVASAAATPLFLLVALPWQLIAWSALMGLVQGPYFPSSTGLLLDLAPKDRRQSVLALNYTALSVGFTVGVLPAGFLAAESYGLLAALSMVGFLGVFLLLWLGLAGGLPREAPPRHPPSVLRATVHAFADRPFMAFALPAFIFPLGIGLVVMVVPVFAAASGLAERTIGIVLSLNGLLLALLALPVNARLEGHGPFRLLPLSAVVCACAFGVLAWGGTVAPLLVALTVFTLGELVFSAALPTAVAGLAPPGMSGAYQGAWGFLFSLGIGAALFLSGVLEARLGWPATWLAFVGATLAVGAWLYVRGASFRATAAARAGP